VQNLVIRDYCTKQGLQYLLSATEYAMANSRLILQQVLEELPKLDGIVFYSLFLLPEDEAERNRVINVVFKSNKTIYFAVEGFKMSNKKEQERIESIWQVRKILPHCLQNLTIQR
jgi:sporadic carbohydrate cluster protein (TIGR04323 family)